MPIIPILAFGTVGIIAWSLFKRATNLRYVILEAEQGVFTFAVFKGEKLVHDGVEVFSDRAAAETAAQIWISQNPNAGR